MRAYLLPILWMALIFAVSSTSNPPGGGGGDASAYAAHFGEYGILAALLAFTIGLAKPGRSLIFVAVVAALISATYGLSDEWHQSFVAGRDANVVDAAFDAMGALTGATVWTVARALRAGGFNSRSA